MVAVAQHLTASLRAHRIPRPPVGVEKLMDYHTKGRRITISTNPWYDPNMPKEFITHESGNEEAWICICGNQPPGDGFFPCDETGNEVEPIVGSDWENLYVCARCGRIIDMNTLEVVGRNPHPKLLV